MTSMFIGKNPYLSESGNKLQGSATQSSAEGIISNDMTKNIFTVLEEYVQLNKENEKLKQQLDEYPKHNSIIDDLQRLVDIYKEDLLTDEEFAAMKKKLIEGN